MTEKTAPPRLIAAILDWPGTRWLALAALASPFALSGVGKLLDWPGAVAEAAALGLGLPALVAAATIATQLVGSLLLLMPRTTWLGAGILAVFTGIATLIAHRFWSLAGTERVHQMATFFEHVAIVGGFAAAALLINGTRDRQ